MYIIPAIDIIDGECVRLVQGEYDRKIHYRDDPVSQAAEFAEAGAEWLHVVDLDGAKAGRPVNTDVIASIAAEGTLKVEVGGGIREEESITCLLDAGVERVIIGTRAVNDFEWFASMAEKYPGRLVMGLDARGSSVATHGWTEDSSNDLLDFARRADRLPLAALIYTDISRDGMMSGPNLERTKALSEAIKTPVVASGGVNSLDDVKRLSDTGTIAAAIIGRALYEGSLDLKKAIEATA